MGEGVCSAAQGFQWGEGAQFAHGFSERFKYIFTDFVDADGGRGGGGGALGGGLCNGWALSEDESGSEDDEGEGGQNGSGLGGEGVERLLPPWLW